MKAKPIAERFWPKVDQSGECWVWTGALNNRGYGVIRGEGGGILLAHRVGYELQIGAIPDGLQLDHLCRAPQCVRGIHLEPVTNRENALRGNQGKYLAERTHCPHGHPYDEENTYRHPDTGYRWCRICHNARGREARVRRREQAHA